MKKVIGRKGVWTVILLGKLKTKLQLERGFVFEVWNDILSALAHGRQKKNKP